MASSPSINSIADRVPELLFRLQYGDDRAALQLDFISKSQPLLRKMMEKGDDITSSLGVILALSEKKNAAWLKKTLPTIRRQGKLLGPMLQAAMKLLGVRILATDGGDARKAKFSDTIIGRGNKPALYVRKKVELAAMSAKNAKLESEGLRKEIDDAKPSADEIRETLKSIPAEEREKRRKELKDMGLPFSNEYLAATFINGTEEKHTWQVNAAYAILTRKDIKREHPPGAAGIKAHISECLDSGDLLNIVGGVGRVQGQCGGESGCR